MVNNIFIRLLLNTYIYDLSTYVLTILLCICMNSPFVYFVVHRVAYFSGYRIFGTAHRTASGASATAAALRRHISATLVSVTHFRYEIYCKFIINQRLEVLKIIPLRPHGLNLWYGAKIVKRAF